MRSAFFRQMATVTALLVLLLVVLSGVLRLTLMSYLGWQQEKSLAESAQAVADLTHAYGDGAELRDNWDYGMSLTMASRMSDTEIVVCDEQGQVLACSCPTVACSHLHSSLSPELTRRYLDAEATYFVDSLPGLYPEQRHVQILSAQTYLVIVSSPVRSVTAETTGLFTVFFYTALVVWLIALVVTLLISRHEVRPIKEMAETVRRFGHGEMKARAKLIRGSTREMEELVSAFNNMADTLERAELQRQDFVANVSHELKTPMTSIAGYLDGMLDGTIPQEQHAHYMRIVSDEVRRLSRMVRSMLEISRMQSEGVDENRLSRFDLGDTAAQVLITFEQKIRQKRLEVDVQIPDKPMYTVAHQDSITQVIYNLMDNAVKFCNDCGYLTLSLDQDGGKYRLSVRNTGQTIPAHELPLIFDRFHKLDKSRSKDPDGVGLGLYIVKTIIGAHGENIWGESHDGVTAFTFTLPAVK